MGAEELDEDRISVQSRGVEGLAAVVEIAAPRVARAPREGLEFFLCGMLPPHAGIDLLTVLVRRAARQIGTRLPY